MDISVILACRDSGKSLVDTVHSVLSQTFTNFELIIVDDGSEKPLADLLKDIHDDRLKFYKIPHSGLGAALNYGISKSEGKYISRIDDDDIMVSNRLEKQFFFMENNPKVVCVGTQLFLKYKKKYKKYRKFPTENEGILEELSQQKFSLAHSALLFRRKTFDKIGGYRIKGRGQDLDLFFQLATYGELVNLDDYLTYYNLSLNSLSTKLPAEKLTAYLFAYKNTIGNQLFSKYSENISRTISQLEHQLTNVNSVSFNLKRLLLIIYVMILGNKYHKHR